MTIRKTFESPDLPLSDLLADLRKGKIQLPDFQRGWIWDDEHIKSLLASVSLSFPIGAVMVLRTGNEDLRFKPRLVEGVDASLAEDPEFLILDGQQRLTSLFLALRMNRAVRTRDPRGKTIDRWYYIEMKKALDPNLDREDVIFSVPADRVVRSDFGRQVIADYSTPARECQTEVFPLNQVLNSSEWRAGYNAFWNYDSGKTRLWDDFEREVVKRFEQYQIPAIVLSRETPKEAVCQVFEKVNTGGVTLTVFELLTATFAADNFSLREDWEGRIRRLKKGGSGELGQS